MIPLKRCLLAGLFTAATGWQGYCGAASTAPAVEKLPLYEYGIVGLAAQFPHYTGSDEYQSYIFPLPYFVYRGEIIKADREGVRGIFWRYGQLETDISLSGNPPARDNEAREGMSDLDAIVELGPALNYYFFEYGERDSFFFQATLRAALSIDFDDGLDVGHEGYVSDISFIFRDSRLLKDQRIRFHASAGVRFADEDMHEYFYEVDQGDVLPGRAYYRTRGGYGGFQLASSITRELTPDFSVSCYGRWVNIEGAAYEDSPLVMTSNNYFVGAMLVWKFGESEARQP